MAVTVENLARREWRRTIGRNEIKLLGSHDYGVTLEDLRTLFSHVDGRDTGSDKVPAVYIHSSIFTFDHGFIVRGAENLKLLEDAGLRWGAEKRGPVSYPYFVSLPAQAPS